jgi:hypothetical protein
MPSILAGGLIGIQIGDRANVAVTTVAIATFKGKEEDVM